MGQEWTNLTDEELCDLMCDNKLPKLKKGEYWIFTFGANQQHAGKYVKVKGSWAEARAKMINKYGDKWGFQYSEQEWEDMKNDPKRHWEMETELEVIR